MILTCFLINGGLVFGNAYDISQNANAELNGTAGAEIAHVKGGDSIAYNPAGVAGIDTFEIELTGNVMFMTYKAPADGPFSQLSTNNYAPIGFLGVTYRFYHFPRKRNPS